MLDREVVLEEFINVLPEKAKKHFLSDYESFTEDQKDEFFKQFINEPDLETLRKNLKRARQQTDEFIKNTNPRLELAQRALADLMLFVNEKNTEPPATRPYTKKELLSVLEEVLEEEIGGRGSKELMQMINMVSDGSFTRLFDNCRTKTDVKIVMKYYEIGFLLETQP